MNSNKTVKFEKLKNKTKFFEEPIKWNKTNLINKLIEGDSIKLLKKMPENTVDLVVVDPPYNLSKTYFNLKFNEMKVKEYKVWFNEWILELKRILKPNGSIYVCSDWKTSMIIGPILSENFNLRNRITWERDKGRGSKDNYKNNIEDIFYATMDKDDFVFNVNDIRHQRIVIAPYKNKDGTPRGWEYKNDLQIRYTSPSNIWSDITIPYWSMKENTEHPTQKPEKLIAKLILASSNKNDLVFDPFVGSGTTAVVARKLGRKYLGFDISNEFLNISKFRLDNLTKDIQGYDGDSFLLKNAELERIRRKNDGTKKTR